MEASGSSLHTHMYIPIYNLTHMHTPIYSLTHLHIPCTTLPTCTSLCTASHTYTSHVQPQIQVHPMYSLTQTPYTSPCRILSQSQALTPQVPESLGYHHLLQKRNAGKSAYPGHIRSCPILPIAHPCTAEKALAGKVSIATQRPPHVWPWRQRWEANEHWTIPLNLTGVSLACAQAGPCT